MDLTDKLLKIDNDIKEGLKLNASDRLRNLINQYPNEIHLRERLAELYYEAGFYDAAGRYWILTEPKEERIKKCIQIYLDSVNHSGNQILQDIIFRGDKSKLSDYAQHKLTELELDSKSKTNYIPKYKIKLKHQKNYKSEQAREAFFVKYLIIILLIAIPILAIVGFISIIEKLF